MHSGLLWVPLEKIIGRGRGGVSLCLCLGLTCLWSFLERLYAVQPRIKERFRRYHVYKLPKKFTDFVVSQSL
ncbi:uncharacterized protein C8R40DRAFT_839730 [Lentinula edodes]|uniref:uncharacterized protein n=1 Tax=Lentinula edodes TaxID=5353 RepID=UPI001E8D3DCF|nr:uncharacterized protein C8R40DRAFT_839730 [Lentinula edodes]KAH7868352.1 hypothetical protein C8R40DRAFT_839730 [Lentinula edodes]